MINKHLNRLYDLWSYLTPFEHKTLLLRVYYALISVYLPHRKPLPRPICFSLVAIAGMFALLAFLPIHPMSIPTAVGGGLAFALITR